MKCWLTMDGYPEEENQFNKIVTLNFTYPMRNVEECKNGWNIWKTDDAHSVEIMYISSVEEEFPIELFNLIKNSPNFETFCKGEDPIELDLSLSQVISCVKSVQSSVLDTNLKSLI